MSYLAEGFDDLQKRNATSLKVPESRRSAGFSRANEEGEHASVATSGALGIYGPGRAGRHRRRALGRAWWSARFRRDIVHAARHAGGRGRRGEYRSPGGHGTSGEPGPAIGRHIDRARAARVAAEPTADAAQLRAAGQG